MLSKMAVKRPVTTIMVLFVVLLCGIVSLLGLKLDLLPSVDIPVAAVFSSYTGAGPSEMEALVTKPLEETLATVPNVSDITSVSSDGLSVTILQFSDGTDLDMAALDMREKVDQIKAYLPEDASAPTVMKVDPSMMSAISIGVASDMDMFSLKSLLEDEVENRLKRISGVASVSLSGGLDKEIEVTVSPEKLAGYGVTEAQIMQLLAAENKNYPSGQITQGRSKLLIRSLGEFSSLDEIRQLPITTPAGAVIHLSDVALVEESATEMSSYSVIDGKQSIAMTIQKQSNANTVEISDQVRGVLDDIAKEHPELSFHVLMDNSDYIKLSVENVLNTLLVACLLAILVIFLFLREVRGSLIIGISIPASVIATFALMYVNNMTFNMISLGGLTIGIGMLVDNSIVVLESVYRHFDNGKDAVSSALDGTKEVAASIISGTLTTCCVFVPMMFIQGVVGQIFKDLSLTICFSLAASLVVALTFVPMSCARLMKRKPAGHSAAKPNGISRILDSWGGLISRIESEYRKVLSWVLDHRKKVVVGTLIVFCCTFVVIPIMGVEFIPTVDQGVVAINIEMPSGSVLDETISVIDQVLKKIGDIPETEQTYASVGGGMYSMLSSGSDNATVTVNLVKKEKRSRSTDTVVDEVRTRLKDVAGAKITVASSSSSMGTFATSGISLEINGDDSDQLRRIGEDFIGLIGTVDGTRDVTSSAGESAPEANVVVNRARASAYGITSASIASAISRAVTGSVATEFRVDGTEIDVRIRHDQSSLEYINDLENIRIPTALGASIPLSEVAEIQIKDGPVSINRMNQQRYITVDSAIYGRDMNSVKNDIEKKLSGYAMPDGYSYEFTGSVERMADAVKSLLIVLVVALLLVYMVMAAQFQAYLNPFIIMFSVPLALSGGLFGLFISGLPISVSALMGLVMLVGMVVNNAIMLIDYTDQLRQEGFDCRQALLESGATRIRPILMTTLTTVLGLLPMAVTSSSGTEMTKPLAIVTIFGMMFSMFVTLLFIPILYTFFDNSRKKRAARRQKRHAADNENTRPAEEKAGAPV